MSARIIDGKQIAQDIRQELHEEVAHLTATRDLVPGLAVILVGEDPASQSYVTAKERACTELGMRSFDYRLPQDTSEDDLLELIDECNQNPDIQGILVQLPLPKHIDENAVINAIKPEKDVDGFHPVNVGKMLIGLPAPLPCTPHGILQLLKRSGVKVDGSEVVVVGRSNIVGKPVANLLLQKSGLGNATVTLCHTHTRDLAAHTRRADIIIAAAGKPHTITADMVKEGAVVIDVGVNRVPDSTAARGYRLIGDVDFASVQEKASLITPVPGGVGPMTITMLMFNTVAAAKSLADA